MVSRHEYLPQPFGIVSRARRLSEVDAPPAFFPVPVSGRFRPGRAADLFWPTRPRLIATAPAGGPGSGHTIDRLIIRSGEPFGVFFRRCEIGC